MYAFVREQQEEPSPETRRKARMGRERERGNVKRVKENEEQVPGNE